MPVLNGANKSQSGRSYTLKFSASNLTLFRHSNPTLLRPSNMPLSGPSKSSRFGLNPLLQLGSSSLSRSSLNKVRSGHVWGAYFCDIFLCDGNEKAPTSDHSSYNKILYSETRTI